jgi:pyruvate formate lyase activating enzyme
LYGYSRVRNVIVFLPDGAGLSHIIAARLVKGQLPKPELMCFENLCTRCGTCVKVCPNNARRLVGSYVTVDEVLNEVVKDMKFYVRSGGGLTVGGGEPLTQPEFVKELLRRAKEEYYIHTAIETSLYAPTEVVKEVLKYVDYIFIDIKHIDPVRHRELTGVSNELILNNIRLVVNELSDGKEVVIRIPIIPKVNDDKENLKGIAEFIKSLKKEVPVELLPYHELGKSKYTALGREYPLDKYVGVSPPSKEYIEEISKYLQSLGIKVIKT